MADCELQIPKVEGLEEGVLTVGRPFILDCKGEFPKDFKPETWAIEWAEGQNPHSLKILSSHYISPEALQIQVTSYAAGPTQFQPLTFKSGDQKMDMGKVSFEVRSVIQQQEAAVEPFGPMALSMGWPLGIWLAFALILLIIIGGITVRFRMYFQRKNLLEELRKHDSALTPLAEIHKLYRQWRREKNFFYDQEASAKDLSAFIQELDQSFRLYLTRTFKVPALKWNDRSIFKQIKKYHSDTFEKWGLELRKLMNEMNKAKDATNLKSRDVVQLTESVRVLSEKIAGTISQSGEGSQKGRIR